MHDVVDERGVPVSRGIPHIVRWAFAVGIVAIFAIGYITIIQAGYGHQWPWNTVLRMDLRGTSKT